MMVKVAFMGYVKKSLKNSRVLVQDLAGSLWTCLVENEILAKMSVNDFFDIDDLELVEPKKRKVKIHGIEAVEIIF